MEYRLWESVTFMSDCYGITRKWNTREFTCIQVVFTDCTSIAFYSFGRECSVPWTSIYWVCVTCIVIDWADVHWSFWNFIFSEQLSDTSITWWVISSYVLRFVKHIRILTSHVDVLFSFHSFCFPLIYIISRRGILQPWKHSSIFFLDWVYHFESLSVLTHTDIALKWFFVRCGLKDIPPRVNSCHFLI